MEPRYARPVQPANGRAKIRYLVRISGPTLSPSTHFVSVWWNELGKEVTEDPMEAVCPTFRDDAEEIVRRMRRIYPDAKFGIWTVHGLLEPLA